jgi:hypothetical protein
MNTLETISGVLVLRIGCPYLGVDVELTDEREEHITVRHPDILPEYRLLLEEVLASPDVVRRSKRNAKARLFSRWYTGLRGGKHLVVVAVSEPTGHCWIVTAYMTRRLAWGVVEWTRN